MFPSLSHHFPSNGHNFGVPKFRKKFGRPWATTFDAFPQAVGMPVLTYAKVLPAIKHGLLRHPITLMIAVIDITEFLAIHI